jgi:hypothetical protein
VRGRALFSEIEDLLARPLATMPLLPPFLEVDFNVSGSLWVIARVESVTPEWLCLRFSCRGARNVAVRLDQSAAVAKRICAAGTRSVPLLNGQPVDVLRRTSANAVLGASEQWQQGEVVTTVGRLSSYGGDRHVAVRVLSAGNTVLGVTYGVPPTPPEAVRPVPATIVGGTSPAGPLLPPTASATPTLLAEPSLLAPGGTFAQFVPTIAHVMNVNASTPAPALRSLPARANSFFSGGATVAGRMAVGGRSCLRDYDVIDVLPLRSGRAAVRADGLEEAILAGAEGGRCDAGRRRVLGRASGWVLARLARGVLEDGHAQSSATAIGAALATGLPASPPPSVPSGGGKATVLLVYWFQPCWTADAEGGGRVGFALRVEPLNAMAAVAPAGTHTLPCVPGQRVECRRLGGLWSPSIVASVHEDGAALTVARLPLSPVEDCGALTPSAQAVFSKRATPMRMWHAAAGEKKVTGSQGGVAEWGAPSAPSPSAKAKASPKAKDNSKAEAAAKKGAPAAPPMGSPTPPILPRCASFTARSASSGLQAVTVPSAILSYALARPGQYCGPEAWKALDDFRASGSTAAPAGSAALLNKGGTVAAAVLAFNEARAREAGYFSRIE